MALIGTKTGHNSILFSMPSGNTPHKAPEIVREAILAATQSFATNPGEPPPPVVQYDTNPIPNLYTAVPAEAPVDDEG